MVSVIVGYETVMVSGVSLLLEQTGFPRENWMFVGLAASGLIQAEI